MPPRMASSSLRLPKNKSRHLRQHRQHRRTRAQASTLPSNRAERCRRRRRQRSLCGAGPIVPDAADGADGADGIFGSGTHPDDPVSGSSFTTERNVDVQHLKQFLRGLNLLNKRANLTFKFAKLQL
jgi:hypothetical protein